MRRVLVIPAVLAMCAVLAACSSSEPALKEEAAPTTSSSTSASARSASPRVATTAVPTAKEDEVIAPEEAPPDTVPHQGDGFTVAVPKAATHTKDHDIDVYSLEDGSDEQISVTTLQATDITAAVKEFNSEDPSTAIPVQGIRWEGAKAGAYGEREYTGGSLVGIHAAIMFAQLPSGKVVAIQATAPAERFDDSLVAACLQTFTVTAER